jgi:hypothetical protein
MRTRRAILTHSHFEPRSGWIGADTAMQVSGTYEPVSRECQYFSLRREGFGQRERGVKVKLSQSESHTLSACRSRDNPAEPLSAPRCFREKRR